LGSHRPPGHLQSRNRWRDRWRQALENVPGNFNVTVNARLPDRLLVQECALDDDGGLLGKQDHQCQIVITKGRCAIGFKRDGA
jgi:hypothetical protein